MIRTKHTDYVDLFIQFIMSGTCSRGTVCEINKRLQNPQQNCKQGHATTAVNHNPSPVAAAPVAVAAPANAGPARTLSITGAVSEYDRILSRVNAGSSLTDALQAERISLSFFSRKRCVAEAGEG